MKKFAIILLVSLWLTGCAAEETFETVADELAVSAMAAPRQITVQLPQDAVAPVVGTDCQVYLSEDYEIVLETLSSGDLDATVRSLSGYDREKLTILQTRQADADRYDFVWACVGEEGQRLGRGVILDDGQYHYCMSVLRNAGESDQIVWSQVFSSFGLDPY